MDRVVYLLLATALVLSVAGPSLARGHNSPPQAAGHEPFDPVGYNVGIRPGSWMLNGDPACANDVLNGLICAIGGCTLGFVFRNASSGQLAIGTAGACTLALGEEVWIWDLSSSQGPNGLPQRRVGPVILRVFDPHAVEPWNNFALVGILPENLEVVDSAMPVVGGPCGVYRGPPLHYFPPLGETAAPRSLVHFGHSVEGASVGVPRAALAFENPDLVPHPGFNDRRVATWTGPVRGGGDLGSPVRTDGPSGGLAVALVGFQAGLVTAEGLGGGPTVEHILDVLGSDWELVPSRTCPTPL